MVGEAMILMGDWCDAHYIFLLTASRIAIHWFLEMSLSSRPVPFESYSITCVDK